MIGRASLLSLRTFLTQKILLIILLVSGTAATVALKGVWVHWEELIICQVADRLNNRILCTASGTHELSFFKGIALERFVVAMARWAGKVIRQVAPPLPHRLAEGADQHSQENLLSVQLRSSW